MKRWRINIMTTIHPYTLKIFDSINNTSSFVMAAMAALRTSEVTVLANTKTCSPLANFDGLKPSGKNPSSLRKGLDSLG